MTQAWRRGLRGLAVSALLFGSLPTVAPMATAQTPTTTLIVQLKSPSAAEALAAARAAGHTLDVDAYRAQLSASQDRFLTELTARGIPATLHTIDASENLSATKAVPARWTFALNGVAINTLPTFESAIRSLPSVKHVEPDREVKAFLAESVGYINADKVWDNYRSGRDALRGQGMNVADIDTGIDWTHPAFTDNPADPPGPLHRKVKHYMTYTAGTTDDFGHGTHVGATIAGDRDLGYEDLNLSDATNELSTSRYDGVAPLANLWGYKVLSAAGTGVSTSIVTAIDDAAARGAHVLNLSLGSSNDDAYGANSVAVNNAMLAGSIVAVAAGNDGPGYSTIGTPATAHLPITVGASTDPGDDQYFLTHTGPGGASKQLKVGMFSNSPVPPADPIVEGPFTYVGEGCTPADYATKTPVQGRIALIARGTCTFTSKTYLAQALGASGALIFNNVPGDYSGSMEQTTIPVGALSQENGQYLVSLIADTSLTGSGDSGEHKVRFEPQPQVISGQIAGFSSRGPTDDYRIKPDVVAPGNAVTAATSKIGIPTQAMASPSGYTTVGGTSMATPHVAGAAALLRQLHPGWSTFDIKNALMNTARLLLDPRDEKPYSVMDQGAGLIDVYAAASTKGLLTATNKWFVEDGDDVDTDPDAMAAEIGSFSFGEVENYGGRVTRKATFSLKDLSGSERTYSLRFDPGNGRDRAGWGRSLPANGFNLSITPSVVTVPAGGSASFTVTVNVDGTLLKDGDYEGLIYATASDQTLHAPVFYRNVHRLAFGDAAPIVHDEWDESQGDYVTPGATGGAYELDWFALRHASAYRVQEATQFENVFEDDGNDGFAGNQWSAEGTIGNSVLVGASEANPTGGWISQDVESHGGRAFYAVQGKDMDSSLRLKTPVQLPPGTASVSYWTFFDIEANFDYGYVEASRDGANWAAMDTLTGYSGDIEGNANGWVQRTVDLTGYAGGPLHLRFRYVSDPFCDLVGDPVQCQNPTYLGWFVDDVAITIGNWTTIAEPTQHELLLQNKPAGFYYYRVAGLFNSAEVQRAVSPWSATVNVRVGPPPPTVARPTPPAPSLQDGLRGINPVVNDLLSTVNGAAATVQEAASGAAATAGQAAGTATTTVNNTVGQVVDVNSAPSVPASAPAAPALKP